MPLTDDQIETLARTLTHIETLATRARDQLTTTRPGNDDGTRRPTPGPRPPCNIATLDLLVDIETRLREIAGNLAADTIGGTIPGAPTTPHDWAASRRTLTTIAGFIRRHLAALAHLDWANDAADDIHAAHRDLVARIDPPPPTNTPPGYTPAQLDTLLTAASTSRLTGIPSGTIRRWGSEGTITKHTDTAGRPVYRLGDVLDAR